MASMRMYNPASFLDFKIDEQPRHKILGNNSALLRCFGLRTGNKANKWVIVLDRPACVREEDVLTPQSIAQLKKVCSSIEGDLKALKPWQVSFALQLAGKGLCSKLFIFSANRMITILKAYTVENLKACSDLYVEFLEQDEQPYFTMDIRAVDKEIRETLPKGYVGLYFS